MEKKQSNKQRQDRNKRKVRDGGGEEGKVEERKKNKEGRSLD